jgi:hypothetical protein
MCRTGGRRCAGSNGKAKATLRQRIHRARSAVDAARAAGDATAVAAGEARIEQATAELDALKEHDRQARESAAQQGDVTAQQQHDDGHGTAVESNQAGGMQAKIREAYNSLSVKKQEWVRVSRLRALLGGDRDEQDKALIALMRTGTCILAPDSNRKVLTAADHEAAIRIGTEMKHLITFDDEDPIPEAPARDIGTGARAESTLPEARDDRAAHDAEHAATGGDVTTQRHEDGHRTVVNTSYGGNVGIQAGAVFGGGVHIGPDGTTVTPGQVGDVTGHHVVVNTNHGGNVGVQADVVTGGVVIGHSTGPVHTGDGVQINGGSWGNVSRESASAHQAAMDAARAARQHAKQARQQAKADRQRAKQNRGGNGNVVIGSNTGGVMTGDGYTVVGGSVYRHPGRSVSVNGSEVTDAVTGERIEPTRSVPNTGHGHSVVASNGVLYVNGVRID